MILHSLKEYYDRKASDPESQMAPPGFEWKEIPYVIVLDDNGKPGLVVFVRTGTHAELFE